MNIMMYILNCNNCCKRNKNNKKENLINLKISKVLIQFIHLRNYNLTSDKMLNKNFLIKNYSYHNFKKN